jgi:DNA-dependent RNA polymerase auxiliary subunit epsilon
VLEHYVVLRLGRSAPNFVQHSVGAVPIRFCSLSLTSEQALRQHPPVSGYANNVTSIPETTFCLRMKLKYFSLICWLFWAIGLQHSIAQNKNSGFTKPTIQTAEDSIVAQEYGLREFSEFSGREDKPQLHMKRFLSVDPLKGSYPELTPYQFASNTPIKAIDLDGLEALDVFDKNFDKNVSVIELENSITVFHNYQGNIQRTTLYKNGVGKGGRDYLADRLYFIKHYGTAAFDISLTISYNTRNQEIYDIVNYKITKMRKNFGAQNIKAGDITNVFKHFLWQTLLTSTVGHEFSAELGFYHERENYETRKDNKDHMKDMYVDLINNSYAREYVSNNNLNIDEILENDDKFVDYMNSLLVHTMKSIPEYNEDKALVNILNGNIKVFDKDNDVIKTLRYNLKFNNDLYKLNKKREIRQKR